MYHKLIIDNREPEMILNIFNMITDFKPIKMNITEQTSYPTGDYVYGDVMVERKTIADFVSSIESGHIFDQCQRMNEWMHEDGNTTRFACIIIVGDLSYSDKYVTMTIEARMGAIFSIMMRYGILITNVANEHLFVVGVNKLIKSHIEGKMGIARPFSVNSSDTITYLQHCIGGIKGIGMKNANIIIDGMKVDNLLQFVNKLDGFDLTTLKGIGKKRDLLIKSEIGYLVRF